MQVLTNHLGYASKDPKKAVFVAEEGVRAGAFRVMRAADGEAVFTGETQPHGAVARWNKGNHWTMDFDSVRGEGRYFVEVHTDRGPVRSQVFEIREKLLSMRLINAVGYSFKAQRSSGEWMERDRAIPFSGPREGEVDVHGGWYDATGDYGIHLSHLSHSTYHNPQQASFTALMFFRLADLLEASGNEQLSQVKRRMMDEAYFGADFLMRMQAPSGSFFRSIGRGDALGRPGEQRTVGFEYHGSSAQFGAAATAGSETVNDENYEVSLRAGGGMAIAALAAAGRYYYPSMEYCQADYIAVAQTAWAYLSKNNERYTNDGRWNLIDEFCALEALVELYRTTREYDYLRQARTMAGKVLARLKEHNGAAYLEMDEGKPFHHAADEGLPVTLAVSLHAPDDELRDELCPINTRWGVREVVDAAKHYFTVTSRRVSIEYALIRDINDQGSRADRLADVLLGPGGYSWVHVNLIPLNPTPGSKWTASRERDEAEFVRRLEARGVAVTVRDTRGREIDGACGQLAASG